MAERRGFFDLDERYRALSAAGDPSSGWRRSSISRCFATISMRRWGAPTGRRAAGRLMMRC